MMSVIDLEHGDVEQDAFDLGSRAGRIYSTKNGRFAIAVSSDANTAHVFDGGIYLEAHGDHFDLVEDDRCQRMGIDLSGDRPVHLYVGAEWATIFYDGSGDVVFLNEHELEEEGSNYVPPKLNFGAQHGAAVPLEGDLFAVSPPSIPSYDSNPADYRLAHRRRNSRPRRKRPAPRRGLRGDCTAMRATDTWRSSAACRRRPGRRGPRGRLRGNVHRPARGFPRGLPAHLGLGLSRTGPLLRPRFGGRPLCC